MLLAILAGGAGLRLGLADRPKPMAEVGGKPLLEHHIRLAARHRISDIVLMTGHLSHVIEEYFGDGSRFGVRIRYCREPKPLGTAGAFAAARDLFADKRFLVVYGDVVMDLDLGALVAFDRERPDSLGTLVVHPNDHPHDSDLVETDADGRVLRIHRKPHPENSFLKNLSNAAVYILSGRILDHAAPDRPQDWARDVFPEALEGGGLLRAYNTTEYVKDMGTPERFARVRRDWDSGKVARCSRSLPRSAFFLDRDGVVNFDVGNLADIDKFALIPGAAEAIREINRSGNLAVLVTNQPVLAKGWLNAAGLERIHAKMETLLGREGAYLDRIYHCPHHPDAGFEGEVRELKIDCDCRKPNPGMLLRAKQELNIDMRCSCLVGDRDVDVKAGEAAGVGRNILVESNRPHALMEAVTALLKAET